MTSWVPFIRKSPEIRGHLFCFPFAGGGASFYRSWAALMPREIALGAVQLPGREERIAEPAHDSMSDLVGAALDGLLPHLCEPYALYGHSMGALVCYEVVRALRQAGRKLPVHLFVSGSPAPHLAGLIPGIFDLPDDRFIQEIRRFGGLSDEILQSRDLLKFLLPRLRADLTVTGTYVHTESEPLICPITAFSGASDAVVSFEAMEGWRQHTVAAFHHEVLPGDHFFLTKHARQIVATVTNAVMANSEGSRLQDSSPAV